MKTLTIEFDTEEAMLHFAGWLCGAGEQDYWDYMEYREGEEDGNITAVHFDYHQGGDFMHTGTIKTTLGRVTKDDE